MDWSRLLLSRDGRIPRKVYWLNFVLPYVVVSIVLSLADSALDLGELQPLSLIFWLLTLWPSICVAAKRCHDRDKSAWWMLINIVPVIGWLWWVIEFGCLRGTIGPNRFGPDPLAPQAMASPA